MGYLSYEHAFYALLFSINVFQFLFILIISLWRNKFQTRFSYWYTVISWFIITLIVLIVFALAADLPDNKDIYSIKNEVEFFNTILFISEFLMFLIVLVCQKQDEAAAYGRIVDFNLPSDQREDVEITAAEMEQLKKQKIQGQGQKRN